MNDAKAKAQKHLLESMFHASEDLKDFHEFCEEYIAYTREYCVVGDKIKPDQFAEYIRHEYVDRRAMLENQKRKDMQNGNR